MVTNSFFYELLAIAIISMSIVYNYNNDINHVEEINLFDYYYSICSCCDIQLQENIILPFFESIANKYQKRSNPENFILDLLRLNTPHLFIISSDGEIEPTAIDAFSIFLRRYIQYNNLANVLCDQISTVLVSD